MDLHKVTETLTMFSYKYILQGNDLDQLFHSGNKGLKRGGETPMFLPSKVSMLQPRAMVEVRVSLIGKKCV